MNIVEALHDPQLLGAALSDPVPWRTWETVLKAAFGLGSDLDDDELETFHAVAGERELPPGPVGECWCVIGRRGGKSRMAGAIGAYLATLVDHSEKLVAGEIGYVLCLAASKKQAARTLGYAKGFLERSPLLAELIDSVVEDEIRLKNNITLAVHTNNFRTARGGTLVAAIFEEVAYWRSETSALPDYEVYTAILPSLATTGGPLIGISTGYRKAGLLYTKFKEHFGQNSDDVLVVNGPSRMFNPTLSEKVIQRAREADPAGAASEWDGLWRDDLQAFVSRDVVESCLTPGIYERPRVAGTYYRAFVDPSGGSVDAMTLAIAHLEGKVGVLDAARERKPPFSPSDVVAEFAATLKLYGVYTVVGDRYAGEWPREQFRKYGITYLPSEMPKSSIYLNFLPKLNSGMVELLDNPIMIAQFAGLERQVTRGGRDSVDHARGAHDDVANCVAGALLLATAENATVYASSAYYQPHR